MTSKIPHVFALLFFMIIFCAGLTYIIPSGNFDREAKEFMSKDAVVPGTYKTKDKKIALTNVILQTEKKDKTIAEPAGLMEIMTAIPRGLENSAGIIFFIFLIGGVFSILQETGVILGTIQALLDRFGHAGEYVIVGIMILLSVGGSTLGMGEEFIPLIPLFLLVSNRLGYDRIFGLAIVVIAADVGFAAATTNPFTVNIARQIAGIQMTGNEIAFRVLFYLFLGYFNRHYLSFKIWP